MCWFLVSIAGNHPPHKLDKRDCSAKWNDCISRAPKLIGSALIHHHGAPINHDTNAGLSRRPEVFWDCSPVGAGAGSEQA